jgi:hypothetical protein
VKDADAIEEVAAKFGFKVTRVKSPNDKYIEKNQILAELEDFKGRAAKLKKEAGRAPILLVYFAGHGFSLSGRNYLVPSNFYANDTRQATRSALSLKEDIIDELGVIDPALQIIITDSCRTPLPFTLSDNKAIPGTNSPAKELPDPVPSSFGKNRILFLYSTLDEHAAYGDGDHGGRFTRAFKGVMEDVWDETAGQSPTPIRSQEASIQSVFDRLKYDMRFEGSEKWQIPEMDDSHASIFFPLPTERVFNLEKVLWANFDNVEGKWKSLQERQMCRLREMLYQFSEFSYYSEMMIKALVQLGNMPVDCRAVAKLNNGMTRPATKDTRGKWDVPQKLNPGDQSSPIYPVWQPSRVAAFKSRLQQLAQDDASQKHLSDSDAPKDSPPSGGTSGSMSNTGLSFGDVRRIASHLQYAIPLGTLPASEVPLSRAVVTKQDIYLRSGIGVQSPVKRALPPGEVLEIIGASPGQTWLEVRHAVFGSGFVSGNLVEPALVRISKIVTFDKESVELNDTSQKDLLATFGLLGGVVIVDASAEYPEKDSALGFVRASVLAKRLQEIVEKEDKNEKALPFFMPVVSSKDTAMQSDNIRITILAFPLDQTTRASLARYSSSLNTVNLDITPHASAAEPTQPPLNAKPGLTYCDSQGEKCSLPQTQSAAESSNGIKKAYEDILMVTPRSVDEPKHLLLDSLFR